MTRVHANADIGRHDHLPPKINQGAILDASISRRIDSLRRHLLAIEHMLGQVRERISVLEREAAR